MAGTTPLTIVTGTTAPVTVHISGQLNETGMPPAIFVVEYTGTTTSSVDLLGTAAPAGFTTTFTGNDGTPQTAAGAFDVTITLSGRTQYILGATGATGDIWFFTS